MLSTFARALALTILGALLGYAQNSLRTTGVSLASFEAPTSCGGSAAASMPHVVGDVTAGAVATLLGSSTDAHGGVLVLDARDAGAYEAGHVDGAMHLPCAAGSAEAEHVVALANASTRVLVYGTANDDARTLAEELAHRLADHVVIDIVRDGWAGLVSAGVPAGSGACEHCLEGTVR